MTKSISLIAIALVCSPAFAGNPETNGFAKFVIARCADSKEVQPGLSKALILESVTNDICAGLKSKDQNPETNKNFLSADADMKELNVLAADCIATAGGVNHDRMVGAPEDTDKIDLHEAMSQVAENVGDRTTMDGPCGDGKMCGNGPDALKAKKACQDFIYWDGFRRTADLIGGSESLGDVPHSFEFQLLQGVKSTFGEASVAQSMARGHVQIPARAH